MMRWKWVYVLWAIMVILVLSPTVKADNTCGKNATWRIDSDGTLVISGSGAMEDYQSYSWTPWYTSYGSVKAIRIETGITHIGNYAFYDAMGGFYGENDKNAGKVTSISIASSVTSIGEGAFKNNFFIEKVLIPDSVRTIGAYAFSGCKRLYKIELPNGIVEISAGLFENCSGLSDINIPSSVKIVEKGAFKNCNSLTDVTIPRGVDSLNDDIFYNCKQLKKVAIPDTVTSLGDTIFAECDNLIEVLIPASVRTIDRLFYHSDHSPADPTKKVYFCGSAFELSSAIFRYVNVMAYYPYNDHTWTNEKRESYVCEEEGYHVTWIPWNPKTGEIMEVNSEDETKTDTKAPTETKEQKTDSPFKHTLDYYTGQSSSEYNPELAYDLMRMAWDAYGSDTKKNEHNFGTEEEIKQDYKLLGFDVSKNYYSENYSRWDYDDYDYCAYSFASKDTENGEKIVAITIRGTVGGIGWSSVAPEWMSNVLSTVPAIDTIGWHQGFYRPAKNILDALSKKGLIKTSKTKYFITGHSRGAGIGNVLAVLLSEKGVPKGNLYDYNFACPDTRHDILTTDWTNSGNYNNIFNINAANDLVGVVPGVFGNVVDVTVDSIAKTKNSKAVNPLDKRLLYSWGKYGRTLFYSFDWNSNTKSQVNVITFLLDRGQNNPHQPSLYYDYLAKMKKMGSFKTYAEVKIINAKNDLNFLKCFMGFCPVNMTIVDGSGAAIVSVTNGKVVYYNNYTIEDAIVLTDGDFKAFFINPSIECKVEMEATGNDTMSFVAGVANLNTEEISEIKAFTNVVLEKGKKFLSEGQVTGNLNSVKLYTVGTSGEKIAEINTNGIETKVKTDNNVVKKENESQDETNSSMPDKPFESSNADEEAVAKDPNSAVNTEKTILNQKDDGDMKNSTFYLLQAKGSSSSPKKVKLTWKKPAGAQSFTIYGAPCGQKMKKLTTIKKNSLTVTKLNGTPLAKGTYYKFVVTAQHKTNSIDKTIAMSKVIHVATTGGKVTNPKKVTVSKKKVKVKVGKKVKVKAKQKQVGKKKLKLKKHRAICFESQNPAIATVNAKGQILGKAKGSTVIYVYAQNGVFATVKVTVK